MWFPPFPLTMFPSTHPLTVRNFPKRNLKVWFSETDEKRSQTVGHTKSYAKVVVPRDDKLLGRSAMVHLTSATKWHVQGRVVWCRKENGVCGGPWEILNPRGQARTSPIPSGKLTVCYEKSLFLLGKSTISMAIFNSFLYVYQRVFMEVAGKCWQPWLVTGR